MHVLTKRQLTRPPPGIRVHSATTLAPKDRGTLRGVTVTSVARTLADLAAERHHRETHLFRWVERAVVEGLVTAEQIRDFGARNPGRAGSRRLMRILDLRAGNDSALERRVERIVVGAGLPPHVREHGVGAFRLDFAWPPHRVALEADGRRWHSTQDDFARDRRKHNLLVADGWRVLRVTWDDVTERPHHVVEEVRRLLRDPLAAPALSCGPGVEPISIWR
ncbi:MAG: endonuclease domain-containing protein [Actinomycetota bacterium]|nr:endonuclease domain-containing protein [Actinomycetota bacterium]